MKNQSYKIGLEVIDLQIKALKKLKTSINQSFVQAVNVMKKCKSKVIICGVGKSGLIASKIASTLSSVGTASFSVLANECSHGDLGKISSNDILIIISNSGNTEELNKAFAILEVKLNEDSHRLVAQLKSLVPEYISQNSEYQSLDIIDINSDSSPI